VAVTAYYIPQPTGIWVRKMSLHGAESYVRLAKKQISQIDINDSLLKAIDELLREVKHLSEEVRKARRDLWFSRHTG
jgi:hypothetical protein